MANRGKGHFIAAAGRVRHKDRTTMSKPCFTVSAAALILFHSQLMAQTGADDESAEILN
jgi:hypothetical protein